MAARQHTYVTADELFAMPEDEFRYELVRGELVETPPAGSEHGGIATVILGHLYLYIRRQGAGKALSTDTGYRLAEDHVLAPDASFISESRIPASGLPVGFFPGAPDMAVEVISPSERELHISQKIEDYLHYGCKMVVVVRPRTRSVEVHRPRHEMLTLMPGDVLDGGDAVPGWQVAISEIFE